MFAQDLKNWPIFSLLEPKFISQIHMAAVFGALGNEALIVMKDRTIYAIGTNTSGCLGTGDSYSTLCPKQVKALCGKRIKTFAYGSGPHVLALTEEGEVYSWGHNRYNELGNGSSNQSRTPTLVGQNLSKKVVIDVACGSHHSLALTDTGEVYAWGQNNSGQLGNTIVTPQSAPSKVTSSLACKKVVGITCGQSWSMAVTDNGEVYGWGYNGVGQLGIGTGVNQVNPSQVTALIGVVIVKVVCGYAHTLALSDDGVLYVWGGNSYGQVGCGNFENAYSPVKVSFGSWSRTTDMTKSKDFQLLLPRMGRVLDIAAFHYNDISAAVGEGSKVFMWGYCLGVAISTPWLTPFAHLHDAFASYAVPSVMHEPLILHVEEELSILDCLTQAFDDPASSDLTIQVQGKPIHVHKAILKIRCQYFRTMFQEQWMENNLSVIEHEQFSYDVYRAFLKYLYTDEVDLPPENTLELLDLANAYFEDQLKKRCIQKIKQGITVMNAALLYGMAPEYKATVIAVACIDLEEFCFQFALNHMTKVVQTENFAKLDESQIKSFIIKAAQAGAFKT